MASARNKAPRWDVRRGCPLPTVEGSGKVAMPLPRNFSDF